MRTRKLLLTLTFVCAANVSVISAGCAGKTPADLPAKVETVSTRALAILEQADKIAVSIAGLEADLHKQGVVTAETDVKFHAAYSNVRTTIAKVLEQIRTTGASVKSALEVVLAVVNLLPSLGVDSIGSFIDAIKSLLSGFLNSIKGSDPWPAA